MTPTGVLDTAVQDITAVDLPNVKSTLETAPAGSEVQVVPGEIGLITAVRGNHGVIVEAEVRTVIHHTDGTTEAENAEAAEGALQ